MWVFVRDNLHQHLRKEKLGSAPFSVAKMPQYLRKQDDDMPLLYRSNTEQPPRVAAKPFAQRRLRPGEEKLVAESKTVFLPRREKEGFGFHINEDGIVDGLAKTENGAQISKGVSIGMRLLAVDNVPVASVAEVSQLLEKHADASQLLGKPGRAARFEFRPAPPPADKVFAEKRKEKAAKQAAMDAATLAASKPYGNKIRVTCPAGATQGMQIVINDSHFVEVPPGVESGEQFDVRPPPDDNLLLSSSLVSSLKVTRFDVWQSEQASLDLADREKQKLLDAGSVADVARQEFALMADRPDLLEAEEDLVNWLGERIATKQANESLEKAVQEQSAAAEQVVTAIEQVVWEIVCKNGSSNPRGVQSRPLQDFQDLESAIAVGRVLTLRDTDDPAVARESDTWKDQRQQLQLQEEHRDRSSLIARRPLAFFLPGLFGAILSGISGAWVIWVDQELQTERLAIAPVGLPLVAFGADAGLLLRVWLWIAAAALMTKFVLIDGE